MRVAQVSPYSWSRPGGVRGHITGLARELGARGIEVDVIAPDGREDRELATTGARIRLLPVGRSVPIRDSGSVVPVALSPLAAARTAALVRGGRYDIVHVHEPMIPAVSLTASLATRAPAVGTFHMFAGRQRWYRPFAPLARRVIPRLAARIAVSEAARWHVSRTVAADYTVVPNGIPFEAIAGRAREREPATILFIGRPEPRKGLPVLLEALTRVPPPARLDLAGVEEDDLAALEGGRGAAEGGRVRALGVLAEEDLWERAARASVVCVPSLHGESFGLVLVEAMAAGAPVVASDVPGYRAILPPDAGRLVEPEDAGALARVLEELLADEALRRELGENGRRAARRYDWARVADEILEVYAAALGRTGERLPA